MFAQLKALAPDKLLPGMIPVSNPQPVTCQDVFMRNSLPTRALIREILYSHSLLKRAILINLSQKIAKFQANAGASNGRFQANIWPVSGSTKNEHLC